MGAVGCRQLLGSTKLEWLVQQRVACTGCTCRALSAACDIFVQCALPIIVGSDTTSEQAIPTGLSLPDRLELAVIALYCWVVSPRAVVKRQITIGPIHQLAVIDGVSLLDQITTW